MIFVGGILVAICVGIYMLIATPVILVSESVNNKTAHNKQNNKLFDEETNKKIKKVRLRALPIIAILSVIISCFTDEKIGEATFSLMSILSFIIIQTYFLVKTTEGNYNG